MDFKIVLSVPAQDTIVLVTNKRRHTFLSCNRYAGMILHD